MDNYNFYVKFEATDDESITINKLDNWRDLPTLNKEEPK